MEIGFHDDRVSCRGWVSFGGSGSMIDWAFRSGILGIYLVFGRENGGVWAIRRRNHGVGGDNLFFVTSALMAHLCGGS